MTTDPKAVSEELRPAENESITERPRRFGTFGGVFTPTLLTILGVIMYLRIGWVMGNAGLVGGIVIILVAFSIATFTALSMSSITTNIRIGAGGAYAIICQSLGLEVGGAVGIPRYLSQALAVTMYIFGFREGWLWIFPEHSPILVDAVVGFSMLAIAYKSADLAIKTEYVIMAIIAASLLSAVLAAATGSMEYSADHVGLWGDFPGSPENGFTGIGFWGVFAVFFPASTGIMAGANMSGDLKNPRRSIPIGTMAAIGVSLAIYLLLAYWLTRSATKEELVSNYYVMVEQAYWGPAVIGGLLGACFSSALASTVGAARILQAMGNHGIVPGADWLARRTRTGEPRNAMVITGAIVFAALLLRDLNALTPLITLFFLITYLMLNVVLLVEQSLGLVSFRPLWRVPRWVSILGSAGCLIVMFIVNPIFSIIAIVVTVVFYVWLVHRSLEAPFEDVRSGLFHAVAEWAAQKVRDLPEMHERAWKPSLLVPVQDPGALRGTYLLLRHIAYPEGSVKIVGLSPDHSREQFEEQIADLTYSFRKSGVFASWTVIDAAGLPEGFVAGMQALRGAFFKPNIVFLNLGSPAKEDNVRRVLSETERAGIGLIVHAEHPQAGLGRRSWINVWIRDRSPDWQLSMDIGNLDLAVLTAYKIQQNWGATLRLITVVQDEAEQAQAAEFLEQLRDAARIPTAKTLAVSGSFAQYLPRAPQADLNLFGLLSEPDFDFMNRMVDETGSTCLFVRESGRESAIA